MYIEKVTPWKSNKWIAPPPHEIARIRRAAGTHEEVGAIEDPTATEAPEHAVNGAGSQTNGFSHEEKEEDMGSVPRTNGDEDADKEMQ